MVDSLPLVIFLSKTDLKDIIQKRSCAKSLWASQLQTGQKIATAFSGFCGYERRKQFSKLQDSVTVIYLYKNDKGIH